MKIEFTKMNGAGNDFILVDNRFGKNNLEGVDIRRLCHRQRGIGADGVIIIEHSTNHDFHMRYYNSDGGEAEMCGNGARCAVLFGVRLGLGKTEMGRSDLRFSTQRTIIKAWIEHERISIEMDSATRLSLNISLDVENSEQIVHFIDTGVPHAVIPVPDTNYISDKEIEALGRAFRNHPYFAPDGTNVNFASVGPEGSVFNRTYERGVERETLACGTGSIATSVVFAHLGLVESPVALVTRGGDTLMVTFDKESYGASCVILEGPAEVNFDGVVHV